MKISKQIEWDMGHRIANHKSKCRNIHGHRYKAEIEIEGNIIEIENISDEGMVIDFSDIKKLATKFVYDILDHGFMVWNKDKNLIDFFKKNPDQKYIEVPFVPTAENIAQWIFTQLNNRIKDKYRTGLKLSSIKLWETPTSWIKYTYSDYEERVNKT